MKIKIQDFQHSVNSLDTNLMVKSDWEIIIRKQQSCKHKIYLASKIFVFWGGCKICQNPNISILHSFISNRHMIRYLVGFSTQTQTGLVVDFVYLLSHIYISYFNLWSTDLSFIWCYISGHKNKHLLKSKQDNCIYVKHDNMTAPDLSKSSNNYKIPK